MRLAIVAPPWFEVPPRSYGGIERVCFHLTQGLVARGHDVTLVATGRDGTSAAFVPALPEPPPGLGTPDHSVQETRYAAAVARALSGQYFDLVHDHSLAGPLLAGGRTEPTLITAHGPTEGWVGDYYRQLGLPVVATSHAQRRAAPDLRWAGTVYNGIDVASLPFTTRKEDYLLFLGRLNPEKGAHLAADACREAGLRLVVAGKASEPLERRYLDEEVLPRLGPGSEFVGEVYGERRDALLSGAACLLAPIQWEEPFGLVYVEALGCGTPVLGLRRGSLPEIVTDGVTGWLCDGPAELAAAIARRHEIDPRACREDAERRFGAQAMVARYEQVYATLAAS